LRGFRSRIVSKVIVIATENQSVAMRNLVVKHSLKQIFVRYSESTASESGGCAFCQTNAFSMRRVVRLVACPDAQRTQEALT